MCIHIIWSECDKMLKLLNLELKCKPIKSKNKSPISITESRMLKWIHIYLPFTLNASVKTFHLSNSVVTQGEGIFYLKQ